MEESHFQARPLPSNTGYTWTLVSRLGEMLVQAEKQYGERDYSWTILGVEFGLEVPQIWYPGSIKHVAVQLSRSARDDTVQACYQLAHECIHLLAPSEQSITSILEEGLATVFSEDYVLAKFGIPISAEILAYREAASLVRELLTTEPDAIKRLREIEPAFTRMTAVTFETAQLNIPGLLIHQLLQPFVRA